MLPPRKFELFYKFTFFYSLNLNHSPVTGTQQFTGAGQPLNVPSALLLSLLEANVNVTACICVEK